MTGECRTPLTPRAYTPAGSVCPNDERGHVTVKYRAAGSNSTASESLTPAALKFDITDRYSEDIVPGSVKSVL